MSSIAVISDIHGNLEALKSVLEDIKKRNIEKIICLGDIIAKGSNQKECLELIKENCQIVLRGNCDEFFSLDIDINKFNETEQKRMAGSDKPNSPVKDCISGGCWLVWAVGMSLSDSRSPPMPLLAWQ